MTAESAAWRVRLDASSCDPKRSLGLDPQRGSPTSGLRRIFRPARYARWPRPLSLKRYAGKIGVRKLFIDGARGEL